MSAQRKRNRESKNQARTEAEKRRETGEPGGGAGRREEVKGSGVYPAFSENAPDDAVVRAASEWTGKAGGHEGSSSELNPIDLGIEYDEEGNPISPELHEREGKDRI